MQQLAPTRDVTFTVKEEALELPAAAVRLPRGTYQGSVTTVSGKPWLVSIMISPMLAEQLGIDLQKQGAFKSTFGVRLDITTDYETGAISEVPETKTLVGYAR